MSDPQERLRLKLEADLTITRMAELQIAPVTGNFDVAHLREIHRRIFQDLPSMGFADMTPGEFRPPANVGLTWMKHRVLEAAGGPFFVAYSNMDEMAKQRLDQVLHHHSVESLAPLTCKEFGAALSKIYSELDYVHPFSDGNSRTLRSFTSQLAGQAGYFIDWERFATTPEGRDALYIGRDLAVNKLAKPNIEHPSSMMRIVGSMARLKGKQELSELLVDAIRPGRSVAFERAERDQALKTFPELAPAYEVLDAASKYITSKEWDAEKTGATMQVVKASLIAKMDNDEIVRYDQHSIEQAKVPIRANLPPGGDAHSAPNLDR